MRLQLWIHIYIIIYYLYTVYCYDLRVPYYLSNNTLKYLIDYILQARLYYVSVYWVHQFKGLLIQISDQSHVNYSVHLGIRLSAEVWP